LINRSVNGRWGPKADAENARPKDSEDRQFSHSSPFRKNGTNQEYVQVNIITDMLLAYDQKQLHRGSRARLCLAQNQGTLKEDTGCIAWLGVSTLRRI
jgi:hypothetical protein